MKALWLFVVVFEIGMELTDLLCALLGTIVVHGGVCVVFSRGGRGGAFLSTTTTSTTSIASINRPLMEDLKSRGTKIQLLE